jgi:hypothetical protein
LIYTDKQIIVHAFTANHIHPGKFIPTDLNNGIEIKSGCPLIFKNTKVGNLVADINHKDQKSIYLYYSNLLKDFKWDKYWAGMEFETHTIQCPVCSSYFKKNESPCKCIKGAPFFFIPKLKLTSVFLFNQMTDNTDEYDCREKIYNQFFAGSLHDLKLMDPIV